MSPTDKTPDENLDQPGEHAAPVDLDYQLIRLIGRGGYGEVWLVRDKEGTYRACKVVYRESFHHDRPYEREYEGIRKFEPVSYASESQVRILHVGRRDAGGYFYYIMELADDAGGGPALQPDSYVPRTLKSELERRGRLPADECIRIGLSLSAALENLHQHGLIHRDIKPANIIFVKGVPKLADIGLVTEADVTVSYVGTGGFIPPEGPSSPQADVYSLGKVLYEISTGKDRLEYPELPANFGDLPDREALLELNSVLAEACAADARKRYASAKALHVDLKLLQDGKSVRQIRSSKKRWKFAARVAATLVLLLLLLEAGNIYFPRQRAGGDETVTSKIPFPPAPHTPAPLPDATRLAQSEAKIREVYQSRLTGKTSAGKQQAAFELLKQSTATEDPAMQLASLRVAALLATEAGDFSLAMQICENMGDRFQMDILPAKTDLLAQAGAYARTPGKKTEMTGFCVKTGFDAIAADDYDSGMKLAGLAKVSAQNCGDARLVQEAEFLGAEMSRCRDGFARVKPFEAILRGKPGDPEASLASGKFLCFVKNDWEVGLPLMAHGTNAALKAALAAELNATPKTSEARMALGNLWRDLAGAASAEDKMHYQERARFWYLRALALAKEPDKSLLRQQCDEWIRAVPAEPGELHIFSRFDGTETIDIYSDEIRWRTGKEAVSSKINQVKLGDFKTGEMKIIKNSEATRMLPDTVDFSTARLAIDHKPKRQGKAKLETALDHVRVSLIYPKPGFIELEVTVVFGKQP